MVEKIIGFAENLTPIALIGVGGIGKTSVALAVLHNDRIKQRFGDSRWFIRCDQFPASHPHFLRRLSEVIGADIENPESLTPLRPFLSSKEMLIVLDNVESILDPQGTDGQEIYAAMEELSRFSNVCVCITSRISTIPPECEVIDVPTLSIGAARDTFYRIYKNGERSNLLDHILDQLDFHPLSITLLSTIAQHNRWDAKRLTKEWDQCRIGVLHTQQNKSLAAAIELSLASPTFQELGPDARALLSIVAFFPQGVDENNLNWLFPTIPNGANTFDKFCVLSLTYRSNGFVTMLAPLRDYLSPKDPRLSPLLCATKERYFTRMSVVVSPNKPNFRESQWIVSEDINVEHLLDVFTTTDENSDGVWDACANFMQHLYWHKRRFIILKPKIEGLSDDHHFKPACLFLYSRLLYRTGNYVECKRLLTYALVLWRERGNHNRVAQMLYHLSDTNRLMGLLKEGIEQAKGALEIFELLGDTVQRAECLITLGLLFRSDNQLDSAEEAASCVIDLIPEQGQEFLACRSHYLLGDINQSKGDTKKAIHHYEAALGIASTFNWHDELSSVHRSLAWLFFGEARLDDAQVHVERAKSHAVNDTYNLGRAMGLQAMVWYRQHQLEEARFEALRAADIFEKFGAATDTECCRKLLRWIEEEMNSPVALYFDGEFLETALLPTPTNSIPSDYGRHWMAPSRIFIQTCPFYRTFPSAKRG